ncbi:NUDIX hydrolase [Puniceicoccus vermicola]|uniref:NUDIX domain-containing protein n=1 Tax=Puniceicoccus vermicola TaxID=388746 RepID=A0A7X1AWT5_9BACT|nr:NUDIX domain-containing protein [Puniceicoccus vermicola]MBC2601465.1 NUDIX domain-containing protein [Puniceicoccus vermicola]
MNPLKDLPFRISTLVFLRDEEDRFLLLHRNRAPNQGKWSPIGGKLDMMIGESPFECARRETQEEAGLTISDEDLHLFGYVSEKNYEGERHWLMFLFHCRRKLQTLPPDMEEGRFGFFTREEIRSLPIPETDDRLVWSLFDEHSEGFAGLRADCADPDNMVVTQETKISELKTPFFPS